MKARTVTVIGAGSSGQAIAGFLALSGYQVNLWNRDDDEEVNRWLKPISDRGGLEVQGVIEGFAPIQEVTTDIGAAISGADVILVNTTTDAYQSVGSQLAPHISSSQRLILMASGTLGTIDMWQGLITGGFTGDLLIGETSTTVFGSRATDPATVRIGGRKDGVEIASLPSGRADVFDVLLPEFSFVAVDDVLRSAFNNMGPALHVVPMVLNAGRVEAQGGKFLYYVDGITPSIAAVIQQFDKERLAVARAFGYESTTLSDYLTQTVSAPEGSLYESIQGCAMYAKSSSPEHLNHRFLWEDTFAGVVPLLSLAEIATVPVPISNALITMSSALLGRDFRDLGRTARNLNLDDLTVKTMKDLVQNDEAFSTWKQRPRPGLFMHNIQAIVTSETEAAHENTH
ncbi:NAD/NADP-dependent octopine/nopaline dehydrogenase family protein [Arthrobacter castelli]|uniref:NAD/NADP-dependent octopine/nopaline dehydrogenase family protein n=1 Tax=Arthrobacter castelli TaxID=271431 RepID=UPI0004188B85|nr:NAD/NADP-dependent octopine/nopaline dehydrogenase family protein [Arthrobacter castelli]